MCTLFALLMVITSEGNNGFLQITVHIPGENKGLIQLLVFDSAAGFPDQPKKAVRSKSAPVDAGKAIFLFSGLKEGFYAASAFHDADEDGVMRKSIFGMPKDAYGFSNDARKPFSIPSFTNASFFHSKGGSSVEFTLKSP
ncbi:Uncharacterized conserved protein, DUF2141 family [Cyclobacterium xiamenense]|jgi:uncharacterized protein (DUF2141 family)|uniref:Uncharacterized conserved protein, DUF2141 family n=2 Tax=Cyclobacterium xiamenense TaxID=1297121 RepID=A0A1H6TCM8_9BACT|nr:Uncharacterized conserved protein, DUF2141 family [Cyclobacterium xiamenense]